MEGREPSLLLGDEALVLVTDQVELDDASGVQYVWGADLR